MPLNLPSAAEAFQIGQQAQGTSAIGQFVNNLVERINQMDLLKAKSQYDIQSQIAAAGPIAAAKAQAEAQYDPYKKFLSSQLGQFGTSPVQGVKSSPFGVAGKGDFMLESIGPSGPTLKSRSALAEEQTIKTNAGIHPQIQNAKLGMDLALKASKTLPQNQGAFGRRVTAFGSNITGGTSNPDLRQYMQWADGNTAGLYRFITGDTRISDRDAGIRAKAFVWRPDQGEPWNPVGIQKMQRLQQILQERQQGSGLGELPDEELDAEIARRGT